ncbi:LCP family protein [Actinorugispora endophytica]|uniref:LytR family transcriptional attenuator n=1 Tax=Actinorugispora endophytica TaxID=1605990 RepID=A0A4R6V1M7_9ACTN|nr:LCP family protein [Actinorugispora endophytica]TDQ51925.1 LytR family transcriptional attenuator [Actinorugispora endophytica]
MPKRSSSRRSAGSRAVRRGLTAGGWVAVGTTALVIGSSLTAYGAYYDIYSNINQETIDTDAWDRPTKVEGALNIMIIGSDVRSGDNAEYGGEIEGERPDSLLIAHISPSYDGATLINLPRDSMVNMPACEASGDKPGMAAHYGMINSAMDQGGVQCQWQVVEQLTGIHIDHFVSVDFTGFKDMVDAVGGVDMCIPAPVDDPKADLTLDAGEQTLNGEQALGYMRSRYGQGDGSDLSRIDRQQDFLAAMLRKVMSGEIMSSPTSIYSFLGSVTDSITVDDELTVDRMTDIAIQMRQVDMGNIQFVTVPNGQAPEDANRVAWTQPDADNLFAAIANDTAIAEEEEEEAPEEEPQEEEEETPPVAPSDVSVEVLNGTDVNGLGSEVGSHLGAQGFVVAGSRNPDGEIPAETTVYYGTGFEGHAKAVAAELESATTAENPLLGGTVQLVIAGEWGGFKGEPTSGGGTDLPVDGKTAEAQESSCG